VTGATVVWLAALHLARSGWTCRATITQCWPASSDEHRAAVTAGALDELG
jgi:hypothetical protein